MLVAEALAATALGNRRVPAPSGRRRYGPPARQGVARPSVIFALCYVIGYGRLQRAAVSARFSHRMGILGSA